MLNVFGVDDSTIKKYLYDHYLTKNSRKIEWLDFANERIQEVLNKKYPIVLRIIYWR